MGKKKRDEIIADIKKCRGTNAAFLGRHSTIEPILLARRLLMPTPQSEETKPTNKIR